MLGGIEVTRKDLGLGSALSKKENDDTEPNLLSLKFELTQLGLRY